MLLRGVVRRSGGLGRVSLLVALALGVSAGVVPFVAASSGAATDTNWTTYHANPIETGNVPTTMSFSHPSRVWTSPQLSGQLFGEPLVDGNLVVVATENDVVYALDAATGSVVWSKTVGTPVPAVSLPCGDIKPSVGITSTPVVDTSRSEVFVVADESSDNAISHHFLGLDLKTGNVVSDEVIDPPGSLPAALLQRAALALDRGHVLVGFGGNSGDCSTYHGWVASVPETGGAAEYWEANSSAGEDQGAVWMGGAAPVVQTDGDIWVATGNGSNTSGTDPDGGDSVVELSPSLSELQTFTPSTWRTDNSTDLDLGSSDPALLSDGFVVQAGKGRTAYLMNESHLGGVGGQVYELHSICGADVDGGDAVRSSTVFLPCQAGVMAISVEAKQHKMTVLWKSPSGSSGPPIVEAGKVWTISQGGTLYGLSTKNGAPVVELTVGAPSNHFPTPTFGDGLLLATSSNHVVAFN